MCPVLIQQLYKSKIAAGLLWSQAGHCAGGLAQTLYGALGYHLHQWYFLEEAGQWKVGIFGGLEFYFVFQVLFWRHFWLVVMGG